jgi:hypothetical protein
MVHYLFKGYPMSTYYRDSSGTVFSTPHGQPPASPQPVTVNNNGQVQTGYWNGSQVVINKK